ncbi:hypothetical protein E4T66_17265 [Sinimarinibacterium sp. CAU 1509]|uniref:hypothetical protein n=1 Tax=Sinimarinibacterium sp. CAU 1509 TaxID=2562283 RepID=UPI0010AC7B1D|nr:hypothetical protein [Sinimarinibacterium sp. CAU 1509]TJY57161.1 hypothetical protein E4T66_17265 [Sinimarinibacterium sp. CAU 1509]
MDQISLEALASRLVDCTRSLAGLDPDRERLRRYLSFHTEDSDLVHVARLANPPGDSDWHLVQLSRLGSASCVLPYEPTFCSRSAADAIACVVHTIDERRASIRDARSVGGGVVVEASDGMQAHISPVRFSTVSRSARDRVRGLFRNLLLGNLSDIQRLTARLASLPGLREHHIVVPHRTDITHAGHPLVSSLHSTAAVIRAGLAVAGAPLGNQKAQQVTAAAFGARSWAALVAAEESACVTLSPSVLGRFVGDDFELMGCYRDPVDAFAAFFRRCTDLPPGCEIKVTESSSYGLRFAACRPDSQDDDAALLESWHLHPSTAPEKVSERLAAHSIDAADAFVAAAPHLGIGGAAEWSGRTYSRQLQVQNTTLSLLKAGAGSDSERSWPGHDSIVIDVLGEAGDLVQRVIEPLYKADLCDVGSALVLRGNYESRVAWVWTDISHAQRNAIAKLCGLTPRRHPTDGVEIAAVPE